MSSTTQDSAVTPISTPNTPSDSTNHDKAEKSYDKKRDKRDINSLEYFATCPKGLEGLLSEELSSLGGESCRETVAGVYFRADLAVGYRCCLWSRIANRILEPIGNWPVESTDDIYRHVNEHPWEEVFPADSRIVIDFIGTCDYLRNSQYGAQLGKDAIVDRFRDQTGERPTVDKVRPDARINIRLTKGKIYLSFDISGDSLHRRAYRKAQGGAPLKENLAAAILLRSGWPKMLKEHGDSADIEALALIDPMCGSGTLLIEAAYMAANIAPGLLREKFGFEKRYDFNRELWSSLLAEANALKLEALSGPLPQIRGYDIDMKVLDIAKKNIEAAGLDDWICVTRKSIAEFKKPTHVPIKTGLCVCNPPYGERLGDTGALHEDYHALALVCKQELPGWNLAVFTGNPELGRALRLRPQKKYKLFNGTIASELLLFDIVGGEAKLREDAPRQTDTNVSNLTELMSAERSEGVQMVVNRIKKNQRRLASWLKKNNIECYRIYDADMPEYSAAVDVYQGRIHIQEYQAPKTVDAVKANTRFNDIVVAVAEVFSAKSEDIFVKMRKRHRGSSQYEKSGDASDRNFFWVSEGQAKFRVNLNDYLDSGLFLDHRALRLKIAAESKGKSFLNLFCYTATASVHAALGGAKSSISVDMSNTYIDWARENFAANKVDIRAHQLVRDDCMPWLNQCQERFDVIMLDPPSFSNSKKMAGVLDIQRDHIDLISKCMALLNRGGTLYFSTNLRSFKIDQSKLDKFAIRDIREITLGADFKQNPKIHYSWAISHK
ncbi:MAG: bifunctional 23S rRNA (guanine(2069)-N(7))-methyltransferase RlmK/23S rRNA (guanine(2445)-N(2))-methyltransferase RlmL [Alteromonadaceae bacterium]|nr:MAG: bifunctional 23S rRNA (guanine(2069)-N(7))-methyltransferase RlmK/23S rRNA (guanine(2445)-N(2))-methyltransferase RlmL [Alteromonadaceae bacterium]